MDYTLERYNLSPNESLLFVKKDKFLPIVIGTIFTLLFFIPIIGIFITPLVTIVTSTKLTLERLQEKNNNLITYKN